MFILLFLMWIILNGRITLEICLFGLVFSGVIYYFMCKHLEHKSNEFKLLKNFLRIIKYLAVLTREIALSSYAVMKLIVNRDEEIQPQIVFFRVPLKHNFTKTILANSITLTPGTITVNIVDDIFCVHALDYTLAEDFENSIFIKLLKEMEDKLDA